MMVGMCSICGKPGMTTCPMCGKVVCPSCTDPMSGLCKGCAAKK